MSERIPRPSPDELRFVHHPLLGTVVDIRVRHPDPSIAEAVDRVVVDEMVRLEGVLSIHDPTSELERWKRGEIPDPSLDLSSCLATALRWQHRSAGAFNTSVGFVTALWRAAEQRGTPPTAIERDAAARRARRPVYDLDDRGRPQRIGDTSAVDLNAFAKGWIVDRAVDAALDAHSDVELVVSAGGDLRHHGRHPTTIGIENPLRPYDNEPPITRIEVQGAAVASSGRARRGYRIGDRWYAHVVDPRTGDTVDHVASISVVAPIAATADVMATVAGLMHPGDAVAWCQEAGSPCFVVSADGDRCANEAWRSIERH